MFSTFLPTVQELYDANYRIVKTNTIEQEDRNEPHLLLEWCNLTNIMAMHPTHILVVDSGNVIHLFRNGTGITLNALHGEGKERRNTIDTHIQTRRLTSTHAPLMYTTFTEAGMKAYVEMFKCNPCLNDGAAVDGVGMAVGEVWYTYRSFCERLKQETKIYLASTAS